MQLPCIGDLWRIVSDVRNICGGGYLRLEQVSWRIHPRMWTAMSKLPLYENAITPAVSAKGELTFLLFGLPVLATSSVDYPTLAIRMDCVNEVQL